MDTKAESGVSSITFRLHAATRTYYEDLTVDKSYLGIFLSHGALGTMSGGCEVLGRTIVVRMVASENVIDGSCSRPDELHL